MLEALFELVARFVVEFLFYTLFYGIGRVMLKAVTLGYPPPEQKNTTKNSLLYFLLPPSSSGLRSRSRNSMACMPAFA